MNLSSNKLLTERAQPWLGTLVSIRVEGLPEGEGHTAIDVAFADVAAIHRLMSFHDAESDVSRLNRQAARQPVQVHPWTYAVLEMAQRLSLASHGCFDIAVGAKLVEWELLPPPVGTAEMPSGSWRDIELLPDGRVMFHRPLWIDLGGIAKGFAVDRATEHLRACGVLHSVVNAGGDIRVQGAITEPIRLGADSFADAMPILELSDGSMAGSSGYHHRRWREGRWCGPHVDGITRAPVSTERFVCVVAAQCMVADALTKVVMAEGAGTAELLREFGASAYVHDPGGGWQHVEVGSSVAG
jgi:thiamine biosynthesis lipoprotein